MRWGSRDVLRCATTWSSRRKKTLLFFGEDEEPLFQTSQRGASLRKRLDFGHYRSQIALELRASSVSLLINVKTKTSNAIEQPRSGLPILVGSGALTHRPPRESSIHICAAFRWTVARSSDAVALPFNVQKGDPSIVR